MPPLLFALMKLYQLQIVLVAASIGIWWMRPENSYIQALIITCLGVVIISFVIGSPSKTLRDNDREIRQSQTEAKRFLHHNLIWIFVGSTLLLSIFIDRAM